MSGLRLLIVTPRFWPLCDESEQAVASFAVDAHRLGADVSVLTAAWGAEWPRHFDHREIPVIRLPRAPSGGWATLRYLRALARWLRGNVDSFDAVYVANIRLEAYTVVRAWSSRRKVIVLRCDRGGIDWQARARLGQRVRRLCHTVDAVVAPTSAEVARLTAAGFDAERVHRVPCGVSSGPERSAPLRLKARQALAAINHDLTAPDYAPVAVWVGRLEKSANLQLLVSAWRSVIQRWPSARLWLIGDGPARPEIFERIVAMERHHDVFMPGSFDDLTDILVAADVFVAPHQELGESLAQLEGLACGIPMVLADTPHNRDTIEDQGAGWFVPPGDRTALADAICGLLESPDLVRRMSLGARRLVEQKFGLAQATRKKLQLIERLRESKRRIGR